MFFLRARSPNARVTARSPPNLPINIFPPAYIYCISLLLSPSALQPGCRIGVKGWVFRKYYHQTGKQMSLPHVPHRALVLPPRGSAGKQCQLSLPPVPSSWSSSLPASPHRYWLEGLLEELSPSSLLLGIQFLHHLYRKETTCGKALTRKRLTSTPPCPSKTPNKADFGQFSKKQS